MSQHVNTNRAPFTNANASSDHHANNQNGCAHQEDSKVTNKKSDLSNGFENHGNATTTSATQGNSNPSTRLPMPTPSYASQEDHKQQDRVHYVSQTGTQTLPMQAQPQFASEQSQYPQIRSQYEMRSQIYPPSQNHFNERAGYVTRDVTYRDPTLYGQANAANPVFTGQGQYVTVQHTSQMPPQSVSPQGPFFSGVVTLPHFSQQPQFTYSQYPQTVINALPYFPIQQYAGQQSPNPQRFSQDMTQYQNQPIIQPIAQNVPHGLPTGQDRSSSRGPKPMVPPRVNSKITHEQGHRKSASVDVPPQLQKSGVEGTLLIAVPGEERRFLTLVNQSPRTRQDGLYIESETEPSREKTLDSLGSECGIYTSRAEHRKSINVDVGNAFQKRNDTIAFNFSTGDGNQEIIVQSRKPETGQSYLSTIPKVSPATLENRKSLTTDRKLEWGTVSPNQRPIEGRRSDYFEDHRRSPMNLDGMRHEEVRRSPMPFMPIRDTSVERANQKSPSFANQNFEKTRQELAIWAEQRQRQDVYPVSMTKKNIKINK